MTDPSGRDPVDMPVSPLATPAQREARVEELIRSLEAGTYAVPDRDVAAAVLPELLLKFTERGTDNHGEWSRAQDPKGTNGRDR